MSDSSLGNGDANLLFDYRGVSNLTPDSDRQLGLVPQLRLSAGEALWIRGSNGVGKSTLLKALAHGRIKAERTLLAFDQTRGFLLPQIGGLWCHIPMRLGDIIDLAQQRDHSGDQADLLRSVVGTLNLDVNWNHASGGERQRTLLAVAILKQPDVLLLDEPFNHIDEEVASLISRTLANWMSDRRSLVLVSHSCHLIEPLAQRSTLREIHLDHQSGRHI